MKIILLVLLVAPEILSNQIFPLSDEFINYINSNQDTWIAERNFNKNIPIEELRKLLGSKRGDTRLKVAKKFVYAEDTDIPESFDAREQWPECKDVIGEIADQSACGSCWAVAAASSMTDRRCIHSHGKLQIPVSALAITACCIGVQDKGCGSGFPLDAWEFWNSNGIVTGGPYNSSQGCQPYPMEPCAHHLAGSKNPCSDLKYGDPECSQECFDTNLNYKDELTFGTEDVYWSADEKTIQNEILANGPAEATLDVYTDFFNYKSGIYQYTAGNLEGGHAVRIIGWGVENDIPYWLIANSWNEDWGENGYFRIIRGNNEVGIEDEVISSLPKI